METYIIISYINDNLKDESTISEKFRQIILDNIVFL